MTGRPLTLAAYAAVLLAGVSVQILSMLVPDRVPSLRRCLVWVMRRRSTQLGLLVAWWWLGWHFVTGA